MINDDKFRNQNWHDFTIFKNLQLLKIIKPKYSRIISQTSEDFSLSPPLNFQDNNF